MKLTFEGKTLKAILEDIELMVSQLTEMGFSLDVGEKLMAASMAKPLPVAEAVEKPVKAPVDIFAEKGVDSPSDIMIKAERAADGTSMPGSTIRLPILKMSLVAATALT